MSKNRIKNKSLICQCGHSEDSHADLISYKTEYCSECWNKRWWKKYKNLDFDDLPFELCTNFKEDNIKFLESLI